MRRSTRALLFAGSLSVVGAYVFFATWSNLHEDGLPPPRVPRSACNIVPKTLTDRVLPGAVISSE